MIFQSLIGLYDRLAKTDGVPSYGFSKEDIGFVVNIDKYGNLTSQPEDLRKKIKANTFDFRQLVVPYSNKVNVRSGNASTTPNFMVDKADYIFGMSGKTKKDVYSDSFSKLVAEVCQGSKDEGVLAIQAFFSHWNPEDSLEFDDWKEISGIHGKWVAFRLQGDVGFIHDRPDVKQLWENYVSKKKYPKGICLVDGQEHDLQKQYSQFKFGNGASLVSFNTVAYESYGKAKGENAPIAVLAEFKSSTALKWLFRQKKQRLKIGDATTVFWAERESAIETIFGQILNPAVEDQVATVRVQKFLELICQGRLPNDLAEEEEVKFYILGLSLNKSRLALRFWHVCSVGELMQRFQAHFNNLKMEKSSDTDITFPGIWHLLKETARETKHISPVLGGALTRSILQGTPYPQSLYQGVLGRIRIDYGVSYLRVAIIKAFLQRNHKMEVPVSLNEDKKDVAYLLGRLFAVLEIAQLDALGKIKSTIKDRFFSVASATPASVFPRLIRLSQHHIEKAQYGYRSDQRIAKIMDDVDSFPTYMNLQDQGLFAIAYYQQKNAISREIQEAVTRKKSVQNGENENE